MSRCVREWLDAGRRAVVLAVQRRACHLAVEDGALLILSMAEVPLAPNALAVAVTPSVALPDAGFQVDQVVALGESVAPGSGLDFQTVRPHRGAGIVWESRPDPVDWRIALGEASTWEPRPRVHPVTPRDLVDRLREARTTVLAEGARESLLPLLWAAEAHALSAGVVRSASLPARLLRDAAVTGDAPSLTRAARGLAGLGPGLTPSGDDLLAGFAGAWTLVGESLDRDGAALTRVTDAVVTGAERGASPLGRAWLGHACRGELLEPMTRFVAAFLGPADGGLDTAARGALAVGASSGTDWMVGFLLGASAILGATPRGRSW